jgi:hypothetical protein
MGYPAASRDAVLAGLTARLVPGSSEAVASAIQTTLDFPLDHPKAATMEDLPPPVQGPTAKEKK